MDAGDTGRMLAVNERNWDARTEVHVRSEFYDLPGVRAGANRLAAFEWAELGPLDGRDVVHLQCHLGTDTLCLARAGANTVGLDFSGASVEHARALAAESGLAVEYVRADVYDAVAALGGRRFDVVYTGKGALVWLPDLDRWAAVVAELLRPGGVLHLVEFHPLVAAVGDAGYDGASALDLRIRYDLIGDGEAVAVDGPTTYTDGPPLTGETSSYQWTHDLGELVTAIAGAGLRIVSLTEHAELPWAPWAGLVPAENGWWTMPESAPKVPLTYSLRATRD